MYSFLSKKYLYSAKLKKERRKNRGGEKKKETLLWLMTPVITVFDALLAGRKSGSEITAFARESSDKKLFFSHIDCAQCMNRKFVLLGSRLYSPSFQGVAGLADAMVSF